MIESGKKKRRSKGWKGTAEQQAIMSARPPLDAGGMLIARCYAWASTCRAGGMALMPVPMTAVGEWLDRRGIRDLRIREHVEAVVTAIDVVTLRRANRPPVDKEPESKDVGLRVPNRRRRQARR